MIEKTVFHSGFVGVFGRPNVGKSTLINRLIGEKVSIVSPKPQTTRSRILGILSDDSSQIVFVDTPGIHRPRTKLGEYMEKTVQDAMQGLDVLCVMVDATKVGRQDEDVAASFAHIKIPRYLLINKLDLVRPPQLLPIIANFADMGYDMILPISARNGEGVDTLLAAIRKALPEGPHYFPADMWTDQSERQLVAEIIRERALYNLREEIPHGVGVELLSMKQEGERFTEIHANLFCEREAHKRIIIGKQGSMLQLIGSQARLSIENLLGTKVNLQLWVKVREGWRDNLNDLRTLGYTEN